MKTKLFIAFFFCCLINDGFSQNILLQDNFEGNQINNLIWTAQGVNVKQENGILKLEQNATDVVTTLTSKSITFDASRPIQIKRKVKLHYQQEYYSASMSLHFNNKTTGSIGVTYTQNFNNKTTGSIGVTYTHTKYYDDKYQPLRDGVFISGCSHSVASNIWNTWFNEIFVYYPSTGKVRYYVNDRLLDSCQTGIILAGNNTVSLCFSPLGWWTGHYQYFDDIVVSYIGDALKPPTISWLNPSNPLVETYDLQYTITAAIKSEKQIKSIKVNSGAMTMATETFLTLKDGQGLFEKNILLSPGLNTITIVAENEDASSTSIVRTIKYNEPQIPPLLSISNISFTDKNGNNRIDGNEECYINFSISNRGKGAARNLKVLIQNNSTVTGLAFSNTTTLGTIAPNAQQEVNIPISGTMNLTRGMTNIKISFEENMGFPPDPFELNIETKEFIKPDIKIVDNSFLTDNGLIKLGLPIQLKVLVQNVGQGTAENVNVSFSYPNVNVFANGQKDFIIGTMQAGESKEVIFEFIANKLYTEKTIPVAIKISEKYGKFSQDKQIDAMIDARSSGNSITITSNASDNIVNINVASLTADVDKNIPQNATKYPNRYALIIGNEDYSSRQTGLSSEVNVAYALNDAKVFREYATNTFGVEEKNCYLLLNATSGEMSQKIELVSQILSRLGGNGELIFYYAGHGFPDETTKVPYLIPVDVNANNLQSAIKLTDLYNKLSQTKAKRITVYLDACFTGGGRDLGLLAARGVKIKPKQETISGNMLVFTATSEDQSALPYKDRQHGIFTYCLLKKLQDSKGDITYGELETYVRNNVSIESLKINGKAQDPQVIVSNEAQNVWETWKVK